ncbi:hypothetical protein FFF34_012365 [Inquilinus sp. KBS0705]|nr:hypothetical protein FFF34_012365 [Inquilinus sp. KBS0705]
MSRRFRKVYLITDGINVFGEHNYLSTEIYRLKSSAENVCAEKQRKAMEEANKFYNKSNPIPKYKVHAFYLIHEGLFEEDK